MQLHSLEAWGNALWLFCFSRQFKGGHTVALTHTVGQRCNIYSCAVICKTWSHKCLIWSFVRHNVTLAASQNNQDALFTLKLCLNGCIHVFWGGESCTQWIMKKNLWHSQLTRNTQCMQTNHGISHHLHALSPFRWLKPNPSLTNMSLFGLF